MSQWGKPAPGAKRVFDIVYFDRVIRGAIGVERFNTREEAEAKLETILQDPTAYMKAQCSDVFSEPEADKDKFKISEHWSSVLK